MQKESENGIYYFLGNITSHILHALPLHKELGGTFVVLSEKAKKEVEQYGVPVIAIDNIPRIWTRFGIKIKPIFHFLTIDDRFKKTVDYLNSHAKVVIFYELYNFTDPTVRITGPKTVFLTHGNMLKDYMNMSNRLEVFKQYDYMTALGPHMKKEFIEKDGIPSEKLVDIGIARTDEIVAHKGELIIPESLRRYVGFDPKKPIVSYMPTFWGASSIYTTGKEIVRHFPNDYTLLFRPHPQTPRRILNEYFNIIKTKQNTVIYAPEGRFQNLSLLEIYGASSVIIGDVSSVMLEAILTEKPLIFAYDIDAHRQDPRDYVAIKEVVNYSQEVTLNNVSSLSEIIKRSIQRNIDRNIWEGTKNQTFFHADGTSVSAITTFIRSLLN